ncbi:MAG: hypothetical protein H7Y32_00660, partial [Chloroflexales bacterium]|nr:hypothetical protein [Chloroflexales bacterium]
MSLRSALLLGVAVQFILVAWALVQPLTVLTRLVPDDAFYYFQIARMLAAGEGSVFSPGEPTNGYHPLWQGALWALAAGTHPTRLGLVAQALVLCVLCNAGASVLLARLLARTRASASQQILGVLFYLLSPWSLLMTLGGLETALW